jgi:hypothetical protein
MRQDNGAQIRPTSQRFSYWTYPEGMNNGMSWQYTNGHQRRKYKSISPKNSLRGQVNVPRFGAPDFFGLVHD